MTSRIFPLLILICLGLQSLRAQTLIEGGQLPDNNQWTVDGSPYHIAGDIIVPKTATLKIDPGVEIVYFGNHEIQLAGTLEVGQAGGLPVKLQGQELGQDKFILWKGIRATSSKAKLLLNNVFVSHARIAFDFSEFPYYTPGQCPEFKGNDCHFENNLIVFSCGENGGDIEASNCLFKNNEVVCLGIISELTAGTPSPKVSFYHSTFFSNTIAINGCRFFADYCLFEQNDTAVWDAPFSIIDSTTFTDNGLGISTHSSTVVHTTFSGHDLAIQLVKPDAVRDQLLKPSLVEYCVFRENQKAIVIQAGTQVEGVGCNTFLLNYTAIAAPSLTIQDSSTSFNVERNNFIGNQTCLHIQEADLSSVNLSGLDSLPIQLHFNYCRFNNLLIRNETPRNLNFLRNYVIGTLVYLQSAIIDGTDSAGYGYVNYSVCVDSVRVGNTITITRFEDVLKHNEYDSMDVAGNSFSYPVCEELPGNPTLAVQAAAAPQALVYPNPFRGGFHLVSGEETGALSLYGLNGAEYPIRTEQTAPLSWYIHTPGLPAGIYVLRVQSGSGIRHIRLVHQD